MTRHSRINSLRDKHQTLSAEVERAMQRPSEDSLKITEMKRQKLLLKEEIHRLAHA